MKIIVFGATGSVGRHVVSQALELGHEVTAYVRSPDRLGQRSPYLEVVTGDVFDGAAVRRAVAGHDAALVLIGAGFKGKVRGPGTRTVVDAMRDTGVRRLICLSGLGTGDSLGNLPWYSKALLAVGIMRAVFLDHQEQERIVMASGLDWTILRPASFTDGDRTGSYRHGFAADDRSTKLKISRADVADFILRELADNTYLHKTAAQSY